MAALYDREGCDELVFLDITASAHARDTLVDVVKSVSQEVFIPLTVGGGIRVVEDMRRMLRAGADKVSVNTAAVNGPTLIRECADQFGSQCVVIAIDAKRVGDGGQQMEVSRASMDTTLALETGGLWEVYTHGGRTPTGLDVVKWATRATELGAGEVLLTSMDADGRQDGYDLELTKTISQAVSVPVIASGGAGTLEHLHEAFTRGKADAVLAASIFHFGTYSIADAKEYLASKGVPIRKPAE